MIDGSRLQGKISHCRLCGNTNLVEILDLGDQEFTGVFPETVSSQVPHGPLVLVKCSGSESTSCGLVQLRDSFDLNLLYGGNYGYRTGLNQSMVGHVESIAHKLEKVVSLGKGDVVLDIGSNDGTLLGSYRSQNISRLGIDPSGLKFAEFYNKNIKLISEFFDQKQYQKVFGDKKAKIISSIAMFYDLPDPLLFANHVRNILASDGIWAVELSYLPSMVAHTSYDTVCHEHLEYYGLTQLVWICKELSLKIVDLDFNDVNGGSVCLFISHQRSSFPEAEELVASVLKRENTLGLRSFEYYERFSQNVKDHKEKFVEQLSRLSDEKTLAGYGASTKGNVILQYCGITSEIIPMIVDVNPFKYGRFTPGSHIPIVSEESILEASPSPDLFVVFPWHFKKNILDREKQFRKSGGQFLFPLPKIEII
jgi:NDP-4-keto-2,6-dideoxyhexose 3-C-methyltransferase